MPWLTIIQITLLVLWYTAAPTLPAAVVFLPLIAAGTALVVVSIIGVVAFIIALAK